MRGAFFEAGLQGMIGGAGDEQREAREGSWELGKRMQQVAIRHGRVRVDRVGDVVVGKQRRGTIHRDEQALERVGDGRTEGVGTQCFARLRVDEVTVFGGIVPREMSGAAGRVIQVEDHLGWELALDTEVPLINLTIPEGITTVVIVVVSPVGQGAVFAAWGPVEGPGRLASGITQQGEGVFQRCTRCYASVE